MKHFTGKYNIIKQVKVILSPLSAFILCLGLMIVVTYIDLPEDCCCEHRTYTGVLEVTVLKGENLTVANGDTPTICHVEIVAQTGDNTL